MANIYRAQIGGDKLIANDYGQSANNAITVNQKLRGLELAGARGPFKFQMETFNSNYNATGTYQDLTATTNNSAVAQAMGVQVKADYMEFMYNITGESFAESYKGGVFGGVKPKTNFMTDYGGVIGNGTGAWQVGYRTSKYSANQAVVPNATNCVGTATGSSGTSCDTSVIGTGVTTNGSRVQNAESARTNTYALNWILNSNARIMFNYAETKFAHKIVLLDVNKYTNAYGAISSGTTDKERVISVRSQFNF
jgi:phosphate-selective porin OprO/OprP